MKQRSVATALLAVVLALGACAPPGGGEGSEAAPDVTPSPEAQESEPAEQGNPDDGY